MRAAERSRRYIAVMRGRSITVALFSALSFPSIVGAVCPVPAISFASPASDGYVCASSALTASVPDAGAGATYQWEVSDPSHIGISGQGTRQISLSTQDDVYNTGSPQYFVRVTQTDACGSVTTEWKPFVVVRTSNVYGPVVLSPSTISTGVGPVGCSTGTYQGTFSQNIATPPQWYPSETTWTWSAQNATITAGQGTRTVTFRPSSPGTVSYSWLRQDRCSYLGAYQPHSGSFLAVEAVDSATIEAPSVVAPNSTNNAAYMANWQSLLLVGPRMSSFAWSISGDGYMSGGPDQMPAVFGANASGSITISATIRDYCGHTLQPAKTIVIGNANPAITVSPGQVCRNATATAIVTPVSGATYQWTVAGGTLRDGQGTSTIHFRAEAPDAVTLSATVNGFAADKIVRVLPPPDATISAPPQVMPQQTTVASVPDAGDGARYAWTVTNGAITSASDQRTVAFVSGDSGVTELAVSVTSGGGCTASGTAAINVVPRARRRSARH